MTLQGVLTVRRGVPEPQQSPPYLACDNMLNASKEGTHRNKTWGQGLVEPRML